MLDVDVLFVSGGGWAGYQVEWYREIDEEEPEVAYWYADSRVAAQERAEGAAPLFGWIRCAF